MLAGIVRELLKMARTNPSFESKVMSTLADAIALSVAEHKYIDTPLSVYYLSAREESIDLSQLTAASLESIDIQLLHGFLMSPDAARPDIIAVLDILASLRAHVSKYAILLTPDVAKGNAVDSAVVATFTAGMERVFEFQPETNSKTIVRSLRMFFLKQLERREGVSFLRHQLMEPPLSGSAWLQDWHRSGDVSFERFLGANKVISILLFLLYCSNTALDFPQLPKVNPFVEVPMFDSIQAIVSQFIVLHGNVETMEANLQELIKSTASGASGVIKCALLLACYHEVFLLNVLPFESTRGLEHRRKLFHDWLTSSPVVTEIYPSAVERQVFLFFASGFDGRTKVGHLPEATLDGMFSLSPESRPEDILRSRLCAHLAAAALSVSDEHPFALFKSLLFRPNVTQETFLPTMPDDIMKVGDCKKLNHFERS